MPINIGEDVVDVVVEPGYIELTFDTSRGRFNMFKLFFLGIITTILGNYFTLSFSRDDSEDLDET